MTISVIAGPTAVDITDSGCTTSAFTPADGDLLVAVTASLWGDAPTVADSLSGTWTQRAVSTGVTNVRIHTRPVTTGASMTVSVTPPYGGDTAVAIYRVSGHAASPIGANGGGNDSSANITPTIFTSTADNSYAFVGGVNAGNTTQSITSSDLTVGSVLMGGTYTEYLAHGYKDCGTSGSESANLSAAAAGPWYWCAVEILDGTTEHQATASLDLTTTLTSAAITEHQATASLDLTTTLTSAAITEHPATAAMDLACVLTSAAITEHPATASLGLVCTLTSSAEVEHPAIASLGLVCTLTSSATAGVGVTSALDLVTTLTSSAEVEHPATAALDLTTTLTSSATAGVGVTSALDLACTLASAATAELVVAGALDLVVAMSSNAATGVGVTSALDLVTTLTSAAITEHPATAALGLVTTLTSAAITEHPATASLDLACALTSAAITEHPATAALGLVCTLTSAAVTEHPATAALGLVCTLTSAAITEHPATAALGLVCTLTSAAITEHPATASLGLVCTLTSAAITEHPATASLGLVCTLTSSVAADISVASAMDLVCALTSVGSTGLVATAAMDLACALTSAAITEHPATCALDLIATLTSSAEASLSLTAAMDLACALTSAAITEHPITASLDLTTILASSVTADLGATGAFDLTVALTSLAVADLGAVSALDLTVALTSLATAELVVAGAMDLVCTMTSIGAPVHYVTAAGGVMPSGAAGIVGSRARLAYQPGQRRWSFRYELLDQDNQWIADLESVVSCTVQQDWLADIKRKIRLVLHEDGQPIDWMSERIQPWVRLHIPPYGDDDYVEWPLGVFLLSSPTRSTGETDLVTRTVDGYDQLQVYTDDKVSTRYCVVAGTAYTDAVVTLLGGAQAVVAASSSTLPVDREWAPGTKKLKIINELLGAINYQSLSFDEYGRAVVQPYVAPSVRTAEYIYADDDSSLIIPKVDQELDLFDVANVWTLVVSEADRMSISATYTNQDPASPTSTVRRGRVVTDFRTEQDAADQAALNSKVARLAFEASQIFEHLQFKTGLNPLHSGNDVYRITYTPLGINSTFSETSWSMELKSGAAMAHKARRVVPVSGGS